MEQGNITAVQRFVFKMSLARPDSKVGGANMGPIWGRQDPGGPHVGAMNFTILADILYCNSPEVG